MGETLEKISQQITESWNKMDSASKMRTGIISVLIIMILGISVYIFTKPSYVNLYQEAMSYEKVGEIEKVLQNENIKYKLANGGASIMVEKGTIDKARIVVSTAGITGGTYSSKDYLSENMMGLTEAEKRNRYIMLKQSEMQEALKEISGIESAEVNLTVPDTSPFAIKTKRESKAGIILGLFRNLTDNEVRGIANYIAASVEKLSIENVTIIDTTGKTLFAMSEDGFGVSGDLTRNDEVAKAKELEISKKVENILSPFYDVVTVTPSLKIDFDKYKETKETFSSPYEDGKKGIAVREQVNTTVTESGSLGGEPGVESNNEGTEYLVGEGKNSKSSTEHKDTTYAINKTVSEREKSVGTALLDESSLAVSVQKVNVFDYKDVKAEGLLDGTTWVEFKKQKTAEVGELTIEPKRLEMVRKATGINDIVIEGKKSVQFIEKQPMVLPISKYLPIAVIVLAIIVIAIVLVKSTKHHEGLDHDDELSVEQMLVSTSRKQAADLPSIEENDSETKKRIEEFITDKPELVAQLLRNWIAEDWE